MLFSAVMSPRKAAAEQARALRALADQIERDDSPLPPDALVSVAPWVAEDAEFVEELRRRSASEDDLSLEDALALARS
jgi:hypothetical protein